MQQMTVEELTAALELAIAWAEQLRRILSERPQTDVVNVYETPRIVYEWGEST